MRSAALVFGRTILYWDTILLILAALVCILAFRAAYRANGGRAAVLLALVPLSAALGFVLARWLYYVCHAEHFGSFAVALPDSSASSLCLFGTVLGFTLAALVLRALRLVPDAALLLDCAAPALALGLALGRLTALFNGSCLGKVILSDPRFFRLPFAVPVPTADGRTDYRFAAFFAGALFLFLAFLLLMARFGRLYPSRGEPRGQRGDVFFSFLLFLGAEELLVESVRNDADFLPFNAFISLSQLLAAFALLAVLLVYSRRAIRSHGFRLCMLVFWLCWAVGLCIVGISEYLVQRHGDWYLSCYALMSAAIVLMLLCTAALRRGART